MDVDYRATETVAAAVVTSSWTAARADREHVRTVAGAPEPYQPGAFYRREMPHLIALLEELAEAPTCVVVDGYVWLARERLGLGAYLHAELRERFGAAIPVVGIAKRAFHDNDVAQAVVRGASKAPLYVTALGLETADVAALVGAMHGPHRLPTLVQRVDHLARGR